MSTVKEVIDEFCDRINQPRESTIVGSSAPAALQYLSLFKFINKKLLEQPSGWTQLKRIYQFTTQTGVANYQLPGDFHRLLAGTQWGVTNQVPLAGPLSNAELAFQTYGVSFTSPYAAFQINGAQGYIFSTSFYTKRSQGYFQISPPGPDDATENVIAYTSSNYVWPQNWAPNTAYVQGDIRTGINNIYYCLLPGTSGTDRLHATSGEIADGTTEWTVYHEPYPITADTDFVLLDEELIVEGLRWAWYQSKKQSYEDLKRQWMSAVASAMGRQNGSAIVNAGDQGFWNAPFPITPDGSWSV